MCRQVACKTCKGVTWAGCGQHVSQVMAGVPKAARCACERPAKSGPSSGLLKALFGRGK